MPQYFDYPILILIFEDHLNRKTMKKILFLLGMSLLLSSCRDDENTSDNSQPFQEAATPTIEHVSIPLTDEQLLELFQGMSPVLPETRALIYTISTLDEINLWSTTGPGLLVVYFYAQWSGPCKLYHMIFEKVANNTIADECYFGKVDIDKAFDRLLTTYNINVLPTTFVIQNSKVVAHVSGIIGEDLLTALINQYKAKN